MRPDGYFPAHLWRASILICLLACLLLAAFATPTSAQDKDRYSTQGVTMERTPDGVFKGGIALELWNYPIHETFERIELGLKWTGLMGQAVESYTLLWTSPGLYYLDNGETLRRDALAGHPDLLKRFDDIKPIDLVLSMKVDVFPDDEGQLRQPNHYGQFNGKATGASGTKYVRYTPHLQILPAGRRSSNFIPSSPRRYREFIDWGSIYTGEDADNRAQNTMRGAKTIMLSDLTIEKVEWPEATIQMIHDELERRNETDEADEVDDQPSDNFEANAPDQAEASSENAASNGIWDSEDNAAAPQSGTSDANGASGNRDVKVARAGVWDSEPVKAVASAEPSGGGIWDSGGVADFEIHKRGYNDVGVINSLGDILIPYGPWEIKSYEDGMAHVVKSVAADGNVPDCEGTAFRSYSIDVTMEEVGFVDSTGGWVLPPTKTATVKYSSSAKLVIRSCPPEGCRDRNDGARERRLMEACGAKASSYSSRLRSHGYDVN